MFRVVENIRRCCEVLFSNQELGKLQELMVLLHLSIEKNRNRRIVLMMGELRFAVTLVMT